MKFYLLKEKEITEFEKEIGYELSVCERPLSMRLPKYYVYFLDGESSEGGCLITYSGNGNTVDEALIDYCKKVSSRRMVFNSYTTDRKEIVFPKLIHTKFLNK